METRVYFLNVLEMPEIEGMPSDFSKEEKELFMKKAEDVGKVNTLGGFQKGLNNQTIDIENSMVLITEV